MRPLPVYSTPSDPDWKAIALEWKSTALEWKRQSRKWETRAKRYRKALGDPPKTTTGEAGGPDGRA